MTRLYHKLNLFYMALLAHLVRKPHIPFTLSFVTFMCDIPVKPSLIQGGFLRNLVPQIFRTLFSFPVERNVSEIQHLVTYVCTFTLVSLISEGSDPT